MAASKPPGTLPGKTSTEGVCRMETSAIVSPREERESDLRLSLLLADDDARLRSLLAARARDAVEELTVFEAEDGAEAVQVGLQQRPHLALLDVQMPRLGGIEAAITLRELHPQMRLALCTADPDAHRERARRQRLPLFDKLKVERALRWLELQGEACSHPPLRARPAQKLSLECSVCGYGVSCSAPPERCPMCQHERTWIHTPWRPFSVRA